MQKTLDGSVWFFVDIRYSRALLEVDYTNPSLLCSSSSDPVSCLELGGLGERRFLTVSSPLFCFKHFESFILGYFAMDASDCVLWI